MDNSNAKKKGKKVERCYKKTTKSKNIFLLSFFFALLSTSKRGGGPRGVKSDGLQNRSTRVRTPLALLRSLSGKYPWERYEPPYPPSYGLNSTTTVILGEWHWH